MTWTDDLPTMTELPALFEPTQAELPAQRIGYHVARAGFGTWAAAYLRNPAADARYHAFKTWKADPTGQADFLDTAAAAIVAIIRRMVPGSPFGLDGHDATGRRERRRTLPRRHPGREVATRLDLDCHTYLQRKGERKKWHHPRESMRQEPYAVAVIPPAAVLLVDDFVSSGRTLTLARQALAAAGVPSFSFAWGCD